MHRGPYVFVKIVYNVPVLVDKAIVGNSIISWGSGNGATSLQVASKSRISK